MFCQNLSFGASRDVAWAEQEFALHKTYFCVLQQPCEFQPTIRKCKKKGTFTLISKLPENTGCCAACLRSSWSSMCLIKIHELYRCGVLQRRTRLEENN